MSSRSTIFLTQDNEHCYSDCSLHHFEGEKHIGDSIILELSKNNFTVIVDDKEDLILDFKPGTEIYNKLESLRESNELNKSCAFLDWVIKTKGLGSLEGVSRYELYKEYEKSLLHA